MKLRSSKRIHTVKGFVLPGGMGGGESSHTERCKARPASVSVRKLPVRSM